MKTDTHKKEIATQIKNAFEFIQKLYNEASYLIKEIEGQLGESDYRFQILRPSGYSVSARSSTGLEANNVILWLPRKFSVAFVEEEVTELTKGQNFTEIHAQLKVLYFKFKLNEKNLDEPKLIFGVFYNIEKYKDWVKKFENLMGTLEYVDNKMFSKFPNINYADGTFKLEGKFKMEHLLDINSSLDLKEKVIDPVIKLYEQI
jgi:hypothetical protein